MYKKHSLPAYAGIALSLLLLADTSVRADLLSWGYNWTPSATQIAANPTPGGASIGYLSLTNEPANTATGSSNTVITNIHTFSTASVTSSNPFATSPDTFTHANVSYTLQLTDTASHTSGSLTFSGYFSGAITATSSNVQFTLTSPATESLTLGGNTYKVTMGTYTPPGPMGAANAGSLNAFVTVTPGNGGGGGVISSVPEPSSALLVGLALPCLGWVRWRKRGATKTVSAMA